ncbi:MAG: DUF1254 domain-containing protein [Gemmataceae bacterium]
MRSRLIPGVLLLAAGAALGWLAPNGGFSAQGQDKPKAPEIPRHFDDLAGLKFEEGRPTKEAAQTLRDELLFQRATQTYLWALPLLNTIGMKAGSQKKFGEGYNVFPVWKKRLDAKTLITTPNSDVIYAMTFLDLGKDGPIVFEAPPKMQGILLDFWQRPIPGPSDDKHSYAGDVGFFGPDEGKGGKFLLLPPGYTGKVPEGYFVFRSGTNNVFVFLRSFYDDPKDLKPAVDRITETAKIYPLGNDKPKAMEFPDGSGVAVDMLPLRDGSAFDQLKLLVDGEGPGLAAPDWLGMLASIGIVKGQKFDPDERTRAILDRAAKVGYKMSRALCFDEKVTGRDLRVYPDRRWVNPIADGTPKNPGGALDLAWRRKSGGYLDLDLRIWFFTDYYSFSPGMISQVPGKGAKYMIAFTDGEGGPLSGGADYRLRLPKGVPAANFWSVTVYDAENASGLDNGQPLPSLGSRDAPVQNDDGSTDLFLGPKAPKGKEKNWIATVRGKGYFAILRLYSPTEAAIEKTWKPGDIEKVK